MGRVGTHLHSNDPMRQVFIGGRDEQDWCKPKIADTTGFGAAGEDGVEDQEEMAPETGPPGEPSISSDPQENAPLKVARDPGDPTMKEREDHNETHVLFLSWCPICVNARRTEMEEEQRGAVRPQFHSIAKLLATRTIVKTRQQPLCTTCAREHQTRG